MCAWNTRESRGCAAVWVFRLLSGFSALNFPSLILILLSHQCLSFSPCLCPAAHPPTPQPPWFFQTLSPPLSSHPTINGHLLALPPSPFHRSVIMLTRRSRWKWIGSEGLLEWRLKKGSAREETAESVRDGGGRKSFKGGRPLMEAHTDERLIVTKLCKGGGGWSLF